MKRIYLLLILVLIVLCPSCMTAPSYSSRILNLDGKEFDESEYGGVNRWYAVKEYSNEISPTIMLQVGYRKNYPQEGYVLFGNGDEGMKVTHKRPSVNHEWWWGKLSNGYYKYAVIMEPDGEGAYYEFSVDEKSATPKMLLKFYKF